MATKQLPKVKSQKKYELKPEDLRWECDPNIFEFDSTESLKPIEEFLDRKEHLKQYGLGWICTAPVITFTSPDCPEPVK